MLKCFHRWEFTGKPDPGVDEITNGLKRLVTGVLTHPMTIGKVIHFDLKQERMEQTCK